MHEQGSRRREACPRHLAGSLSHPRPFFLPIPPLFLKRPEVLPRAREALSPLSRHGHGDAEDPVSPSEGGTQCRLDQPPALLLLLHKGAAA
jgi:hypothetical protein